MNDGQNTTTEMETANTSLVTDGNTAETEPIEGEKPTEGTEPNEGTEPMERDRKQTDKGLAYSKENKQKSVSKLFRQIKQKSERVQSLISDNHEESEVRSEYKQWMSAYENLLKDNSEYCMLLSSDELQDYLCSSWDSRDTFLKNFKVFYAKWEERVQQQKEQLLLTRVNDNMTSVSRRSKNSSKSSLNSVVSSARLKSQQQKAAIEAKMLAFKKKQELETAKLKLKLQEEELTLNTEMAVVAAKEKVLDNFVLHADTEITDTQTTNKVESEVTQVNHGMLVNNITPNAKSPLNVNAKCFEPNCHIVDDDTCSLNVLKECHVINSTDCVQTPCQGTKNDVSDKCAVNQNNDTGKCHANGRYVDSSFDRQLEKYCVSNITDENVLLSVVRQLRKPTPEIKRFSGEPAEYRKFIRHFNTKVAVNSDSDDERMSFLEQFTTGEANRIVSGFSHLPAEHGYPAALNELEVRYGDIQLMAHSFIKKALDWPVVRPDNAKSLDDFAILLVECENAVKCIQAIKVLEYPDNMRKLVGKLPFYLHDKWRNIVQQTSRKGETVQFHQLVQFVKDEARKATDPLYGKEAMSREQKGFAGKAHSSQKATRAKGSFVTEVSNIDKSGSNSFGSSETTAQKANNQSSKRHCIYCDSSTHSTDRCRRLSGLQLSNRTDFVKSKGLCFGCMKRGHQNKDCHNKSVCDICKLRHPTVLHDETRERKCDIDTKTESDNIDCTNYVRDVCSQTRAGNGQCTMAIVPVQVKLKNGLKTVRTYAFMDPGSTVTFCSESLARQLGASGQHMSITLDTMGKPFTMKTCAIDGLQVGDLEFSNEITLPRTYTKDIIPVSQHHIPRTEDIVRWEHLRDVQLPTIDAEIGLLLGNNVADAYTPCELKTGPKGSPHATKTMLGWVVWNVLRDVDTHPGSCGSSFTVNRAEVMAVEEMEDLRQLDRLVKESINMDFPERLSDDKREHSQEDNRFLKSVSKSIVLTDGHYCIGLPFKREDVRLPDNRSQALQRLESLKRKICRNEAFGRDYREFMSNIMSNGYAEEVPKADLNRADGRVWYIPHHGVYHPRKPEKIRIVFDCAASFLGTSLNNVLLQGPDLTNSLLGVLLRFRQEDVAVMGDIEAMFFQVLVPHADSDCLRFFWWPNGNIEEDPVAYRMKVHLFGAVSSPSCASFALQQTARDNHSDSEPTSSKTVNRNIYVDDCLASVATKEEATGLIKNTVALCKKGGFNLTKWVSNDHDVLESVPVKNRAKDIKELQLDREDLPNERALGVYWRVESDTLGFKINLQPRPSTRRGILAVTSSVYDPLGIASPVILKAKMLLQSLCKRNVGWDEEIHSEDFRSWTKWLSEITELDQLNIRRCYKPVSFGQISSYQLHLFADASQVGYGIAAYLRVCNEDAEVSCSLIMGKARVAPLKAMTIPRMELTAATIAVKLSKVLVNELDYNIEKTFFWTDSMTVLRYIANESSRFQTFVANRLAIIRDASCVHQWRYVDTKSNPADCASRGLSANKFLECDLWFKGPSFLTQPETEWPQASENWRTLADDDVEIKKGSMSTVQKQSNTMDRLIENFSNWTKLRKTVAWLLLGMDNLKERVAARKKLQWDLEQTESDPLIRDQKYKAEQVKRKDVLLHRAREAKPGRLTVEHMEKAERILVGYVQQKHFKEDIRSLKQSKLVKKTSALRKLDPKVVDGLIRVGGRLEKAHVDFDSKHQILLPKDAHLSKLILEDIHKSVGHLGKNAILAKLRQHYWVIGAPSLIKGIVSKCVTCKRYQAPAGQQKMANLPEDRLASTEPPFTNVGMDYFGPFEVKRGRSNLKRYGVVFTCLTSRAVHLEVAHSLDTDSCVNAIRRFIARRGTVKHIRSDNGTNLVGAEKEMRKELQNWNTQKIHGILLQKAISWEFNPPTASHFGGIWERLIRLARKILYSLLREQNLQLNDESLQTLFCEVEAIMNGRPLTECPNSARDLDVLTPNHLLLLNAGETSPPGSFSKADNYPKRRWRQVQYLLDMYWKRWVREYLPLLQERQKWHQSKRNVATGDIVLVMDSTPRNSWALGRVLEVFPDRKGLVRSVKLKTKTSTLVRPVAKLCLLLECDTQ